MSRTAFARALIAALVAAAALPADGVSQVVDTVRVGSGSLAGVRPEPGTTRVASFTRSDGTDTPTSTTTQRVGSDTRGGVEVFVIETGHTSPDGETTRSTIVVRASDFALLHHRVKADRDSAAVTSSGTALTGWVALPGEPVSLLDRTLERPVFPVEGQLPWLFPLLPLAEEYAAAIPRFSQWAGVEEWSTIRVLGSERIAHEGGDRDCWVVDGGELFPGHRVTYWVDRENRRILQGVARGEAGGPEYWSRLTGFEPAERADPVGLEVDIERTIDAYVTALTARDFEALRELYVADERFVWIEDSEVRYRSAEDVIAAFAAFPAEMAIHTTLSDLSIVPAGDSAAHAWARFETRIGEGEDAFSFSGSLSFVLERSGETWRILGGHTSSARAREG